VPYLIAAVTLASALGLLNLLLTLGVIRRLRETATHDAGAHDRQGILSAGRIPSDFTATDTDGRPLSRGDLTGTVLVGFFSTSCDACVIELPRFVSRAGDHAGGRDQVLAVVDGDRPAVDEVVRQLTGVARVVVEEAPGTVATAFQVEAFPSWCLLDNGTVEESGSGASQNPTAAMV
jgi:hypothetical protein